MENKIKRGQILKELRLSKGLKQSDIAELMGISQQAYQRYEYGTSEPNGDGLIFLADYYDVSTDYLLGRTKPEMQAADKDPLAGIDIPMTETERKILTIYLSLNEGTRKDLMDFLKNANRELSETSSAPEIIIAESRTADLKTSDEAARKDAKKLG